MSAMETESVRSGRSERSERSRHGHGQDRHGHHRHHGRHGYDRHSQASYGSRHHRDRHSRHTDRETDRETDRDDRSGILKPPSVTALPGLEGEGRLEGERIEVQILPQDDNWGETTTAITGATSEAGFSMEDMSRINKDLEDSIGFNCVRYLGTTLAAILGLAAFLSPVAMVILPQVGIKDWQLDDCGVKCEGLFISLAFKLLILLIGTWALFFRKPKATMPRIFIFRALILFMIFVLTFAFWLFYGVRIFELPERDYHSIVLFAVSLVDSLLFIHYLAIIVLEIRQLQPQYVIKVVRSPDGDSRLYTIGQLSIQRMAVWVLEQYYKDFNVYNPYLDNIPRKPTRLSGFKFYDVDGVSAPTTDSRTRAIFAAQARRRDSSHNDRFYEEQEYERRVRKRRARLIVAAEEGFTHIKHLQEEQGAGQIPMGPHEAAQAVIPSMARALQKYLRITRQQPRYTLENIINHLATCIKHDMSPKSFLERYLTQGPIIWNNREYKGTHTWVLVCDQLLCRAVEHETIFQLRQGDVSLLITVRRLPHFNLTEEVIDAKSNKFVLRMNSETSV